MHFHKESYSLNSIWYTPVIQLSGSRNRKMTNSRLDTRARARAPYLASLKPTGIQESLSPPNKTSKTNLQKKSTKHLEEKYVVIKQGQLINLKNL